MGYAAIAKGLATGVAGKALDVVPGGGVVKSVLKGVGGLFGGKGPKYAKSLAETRAAGKRGDVATLQFKLANTKYPEVAKSAKAYLDVILAKSTGSRSDGWLQTKARAPVLVSGAGPLASGSPPLVMRDQGSQSLPLPSPGSRHRRRKRRSSYRSHSRKSRAHSRKSRFGRRRKKTTHRKRKLKFGSRAWRLKYLGHK